MNYELRIKICMENYKIKTFQDLRAWKESHTLAVMIYKITKVFPKEELFGLVSQLRRAVVSVSSNIAEGFSRGSYKDKLRFYYMALGSLTEVQNQIIISKDIGYIGEYQYISLMEQSIIAHKIINGLIKRTKDFI